MSGTANVLINVVDGTRKAFANPSKVYISIANASGMTRKSGYFMTGNAAAVQVPFIDDNYSDLYSVNASADGYGTFGFYPVHVKEGQTQTVNLMLLPKNGRFIFRDNAWADLKANAPISQAFCLME